MVLQPKPWKTLAWLVVSLAFVAAGIAGAGVVGWLCAAFFGLCAVAFALQLAPGSSNLRLTPEGFVLCSLFRKWTFLWQDVSNFRAVEIPPARKKFVFDARNVPEGIMARMSREIVGANAALPDTYGMKPEDLADLLNDWRARAL